MKYVVIDYKMWEIKKVDLAVQEITRRKSEKSEYKTQ